MTTPELEPAPSGDQSGGEPPIEELVARSRAERHPPQPSGEPRGPRPLDVLGVLQRLDRAAERAPGSSASKLAAAFRATQGDLDEAERERWRKQAHEEDLEERRAAVRAARWRRYELGRPVMFEAASLDGLLPEQDPDHRVSRWWESGKRNLLLVGPAGHGKTHAAYAVTNRVAAEARDARMASLSVISWRVVDLAAALEPPDAHQARDETFAARQEDDLRSAMTCDLLLLDDLHIRKATDWWREQLYRILDHRVSTPGRRTVMVFNCATKEQVGTEIASRLGPEIASRMKLGTLPAWIEGADLRRFEVWDPFADGG